MRSKSISLPIAPPHQKPSPPGTGPGGTKRRMRSMTRKHPLRGPHPSFAPQMPPVHGSTDPISLKTAHCAVFRALDAPRGKARPLTKPANAEISGNGACAVEISASCVRTACKFGYLHSGKRPHLQAVLPCLAGFFNGLSVY